MFGENYHELSLLYLSIGIFAQFCFYILYSKIKYKGTLLTIPLITAIIIAAASPSDAFSMISGILVVYCFIVIWIKFDEIMPMIDESKLIIMSLPVLLLSLFFVKNAYITILSSIIFIISMYEGVTYNKPNKRKIALLYSVFLMLNLLIGYASWKQFIINESNFLGQVSIGALSLILFYNFFTLISIIPLPIYRGENFKQAEERSKNTITFMKQNFSLKQTQILSLIMILLFQIAVVVLFSMFKISTLTISITFSYIASNFIFSIYLIKKPGSVTN